MTSGSRARPNIIVAASCATVAAAMVAMTYAAVPLYKLFCQATGFGGTTQRAAAAPRETAARTLTVEFDANTAASLPWTFEPAQRRVRVRIGEEALVHYRARNDSNTAVAGAAMFNVTPDKAGRYFAKIQCFCFVEQTLQAGQAVDMPVSFFIDPAISRDPDLAELKTITLSYTFY
ncbi:MAG: cytochrome c oxidase assembly protein, partial [Pseudomonadota bacterium]|nr:cytochrome c oxidase assembly protein [Pseudomonadota bacterium]